MRPAAVWCGPGVRGEVPGARTRTPRPPVHAGSGQTSWTASVPVAAAQDVPDPVGGPRDGRGHLQHLGRARHVRVRAGWREPFALLELGAQVIEFLLAEREPGPRPHLGLLEVDVRAPDRHELPQPGAELLM